MSDAIIKFIANYIPLTSEEIDIIQEQQLICSYKKDTLLLAEGEYAKDCYFILTGCVRRYYVINGEERTTEFFTEGQAITPAGYITKQASTYNLSCVEDCISFNLEGVWSKPQNLGDFINSPEKEFSPFYANGVLYFTRRSQSDGAVKEGIYQIPFNPEVYHNLVRFTAKEFAPGIISTGNGFSTAFEPSGKKVYFVKAADEFKQVQKLFYSIQKEGRWTRPLMDPVSDTSNFITSPFITRKGNIMLFAANLNKMDLYIRRRENGHWGPAIPLPGKVNTSEYHEYFGTLSDNMNLYFASDRGLGGGDIFVARYENGTWQQPAPIVELNTSSAESNPLIAPDESFLVFMAKRPEGFGDYDLYISYREGTKWGHPLNLGPMINTGVKDFQPAFSPDGKYLYFSRVPWPSGAPAEYGNEYIYSIDINILKQYRVKK